MLESNKEKFNAVQQRWAEESLNGVPAEAQGKREGTLTYYTNRMNDKTLTDAEMSQAYEAVANGNMGLMDYMALFNENNRRKQPDYKKPEILTSAEYKAVDKGLKAAHDAGMFDPYEEPDGGEEELVAWQMDREIAYAQVKNDHRKAAIAAARNNQPFSSREWWNKYQKDTVNEGKTSSTGFIKKALNLMFDVPGF